MPAPLQRDPDLWTLEQVAARLGISPSTARRLAQRGELPGARKTGRRWDVSRIAFERAYHGDAKAAS